MGIHRKVGIIILLSIPFLVLVVSGLRGIDFGNHVDEFKQILLVKQAVNKGIVLPGWYHYPSTTYWLSLSTIAPHVAGASQNPGFRWKLIREHLKNFVLDGKAFHLQVRKVFLVVSALTLVWLPLAILVWRRPWYEALVASSILGFSWEIGYHVRWIAPDGVLMQFGALTILLVALAVERTRQWPWLWLAAIAAGFGAGTKYPGGLLLLPVLIPAFQARYPFTSRAKFGLLVVGLVALFVTGYLITTPGTVLETQAFLNDVRYEIDHYQTGHEGRFINPGFEHLYRITVYYSQVLFSRFTPISLLLFGMAILGGFAILREEKKTAVLILSFPVLYTLYFSFQRIMSPRNYLVVAPFLAILAARGFTFIWDKLKPHKLRTMWGILVAGLLVTNALWLFYAAETIRDRETDRFLQAFAAYVSDHASDRFLVTDEIWEKLTDLNEEPPQNVTRMPGPNVDAVAFYSTEEILNELDWPLSLPNPDVIRFGTLEVNTDYYPRWGGDRRILVMPVDKAREMGYSVGF